MSKTSSASKGRSGVTNGRRPFLRKTLRTPEFRRLKDILDQLFRDRGGIENLSIEAQSSCRVYAGLCVQQEIILARLAAGEAVASADIARTAYALERARRAMGEPPKRQSVKGRVVASVLPGAGVRSLAGEDRL